MVGPTEDPALDFFQVPQCQRQLDPTVSELFDLLRRMPLTFRDLGGGEGVEGDPDRVFGFAWLRKNAKAFAEEFANREIKRAPKLAFAHPDIADPRKSECAQLLAIDIEGKQIPKVFDAAKVIGLDVALLVSCSFGFLIFEADFELFEDGVA